MLAALGPSTTGMPELVEVLSAPQAPDTAAVWDDVESLAGVAPTDKHHNLFELMCGRWAAEEKRPAVFVRDQQGCTTTWTYRDLDQRSARLAGYLARAFGVSPGDRVAGLLDRGAVPWLVACAVWRLGAVYVPLHVGFGEGALSERLRLAQARVLVAEHRLEAVVSNALPSVGHDVALLTHGAPSGNRAPDLEEALTHAPRWEVALTAAEDLAVLMFTSGTSGAPKACTVPHNGWLAPVPFITHVLAPAEGDRMLTTSDPGWSYGLITTGASLLAMGVAVVVQTGRFDADRSLDALESEGVTHLSGAPTAFRAMLATVQKRGGPSTLRSATCGGEALDPETRSSWRRHTGTALRDGYGLTELGMVLADDGSPDGRLYPIPGWEVGLLPVGDDGASTAGRLLVRRPRYQLSTGYLNADAEWRGRWTDDGWFVTEDLFHLHTDGGLTYVGRMDDVIVSSGYNISPTEVESAIRRHPAVLDAAAVPAAQGAGGVVVRAVVQLRPGVVETVDLTQAIQTLVRDCVGRHAAPRLVEYVEELPRTESGKLRRRDLRAGEQPGLPVPESRSGQS